MSAHFAARNAAAPRTQIAHQIAGILIWCVNLDVHDWLEESGPRLLHCFLEGQGTRNLKSDVGRIDVVIFAVIENGAKISHRKSRKVTADGRVPDPLFNGRNPVLRNRTAENVVNEFDPLATLDRFELHAAYAELAVTARLLLVFALRVSFAANRFAVRNLRRLQC